MRKFLILYFAVISFIFLTFQTSCTQESKDDLKFTISLDKGEYLFGEPVNCIMKLENVCKTSLNSNVRFLVNLEDPSPHEIYFIIKDPDGHRLHFNLLIRAGAPQTENFKVINPGDFEEGGIELTQAYSFKNKGEYTIGAVYESKILPEGLKEGWKGRILSNIVKVRLK